MTRKLATVRKIASIEPIEGADKICLARVDGWQIVTQKDWCKPGDLICYFEVDSFLPVRPEFEFLRKNGFKSTKNLGDGFRLKTIKLRKTLSQGLIMPLNLFEEFCNPINPTTDDLPPLVLTNLIEGTDVTEILGVKLYEKPIPTQLAGRVKGNFPIFIRKTDQERAQNIVKEIKSAVEANTVFEATLKFDGSSMTIYNHPIRNGAWGPFGDFSFNGKETDIQGVCSRNWDLAPDEEDQRKNSFWKCAQERGLIEKIKLIKAERKMNVALQGELMGPGVQDNRESLTGLEFFCFDIWDIDQQEYLLPEERRRMCKEFSIVEVPHIRDISLADICLTDDVIMHLLKFADRPSYNQEVPAEGVVFKSLNNPRYTFKIINNEYLLQEKD